LNSALLSNIIIKTMKKIILILFRALSKMDLLFFVEWY